MSTPITEKEAYSFPAFEPNPPPPTPQMADTKGHERRSSDEDDTLQGERTDEDIDNNRLRISTSYMKGDDHLSTEARDASPMSPSAQRERSRRLTDDLEMLRAERVVSNAERSQQESSMGRTISRNRSKARTHIEPQDDFDVGTTPIHEQAKIYKPPEDPTTKFAKVFKTIHESSFLVRYFFYILPLTILLLIPIFLGFYVFKQANVAGVELFWFGIWLEIVWLTLWLGRVGAQLMIPCRSLLILSRSLQNVFHRF